MHIDRYNYEEYFLLFADNELSPAGKKTVEEFAAANPDLQAELDLLQRFRLIPEEKTFPDKKSLLRTTGSFFTDTDNYQERFLLYADNELTGEDRVLVEQFVQEHPALKQELELISKAVLTPDHTIRFPRRESLHRHEHEKVVSISWWKIAAAAAVLIFTAGSLWLGRQYVTGVQPQIAYQQNTIPADPERAGSSKYPDAHEPLAKQATGNNVPSVTSDPAVAMPDHNTPATMQHKHITAAKKTAEKPENDELLQTRLPQAAETIHPASDLALSNIAPSIIKNQLPAIDRPAIFIDAEDAASTKTANITFASNNDSEDVYISNIPLDKKHALRGLFRKASRIINKATGDKGLLIGTFETALR